MSDLEDLARRLTALEEELAEVRQDAAAARALAAGADRDVAEYRAEMRQQTRLLNALRETQVEQGHDLVRVDGALQGVNDKLDDQREGLAHIVRLLEGLGATGA